MRWAFLFSRWVLLLRREQRLLAACAGWIHLRVQEIGQVIHVLRGAHHRRHKAMVRRVRLVVMQHRDKVMDAGAVAAVHQHAHGAVAIHGVA